MTQPLPQPVVRLVRPHSTDRGASLVAAARCSSCQAGHAVPSAAASSSSRGGRDLSSKAESATALLSVRRNRASSVCSQTPSTLANTRSKRASASSMTSSVSAIDGVHARAGQGDDAAGRVGGAHLLHHVLARLETAREAASDGAGRAASRPTSPGARSSPGCRRRTAGRSASIMACRPRVRRSPARPGQHRRVRAFHLEQREVAGRARQRVGGERAADVGALAALAADPRGEARHHVARGRRRRRPSG